MTYIVKVINCETGEVVKEIECDTERSADRVDGGLNINLKHEQFYTLIEKREPA